jgi:hypothetical protein
VKGMGGCVGAERSCHGDGSFGVVICLVLNSLGGRVVCKKSNASSIMFLLLSSYKLDVRCHFDQVP